MQLKLIIEMIRLFNYFQARIITSFKSIAKRVPAYIPKVQDMNYL